MDQLILQQLIAEGTPDTGAKRKTPPKKHREDKRTKVRNKMAKKSRKINRR